MKKKRRKSVIIQKNSVSLQQTFSTSSEIKDTFPLRKEEEERKRLTQKEKREKKISHFELQIS